MKHFEQTWILKDGMDIYSQGWEPESEPRGVVCLVHGLGEHSGRYEHVASHLNKAGYALMSADLRGHGKSAGIRGHIPSTKLYLDHIDRLLNEAGNRYPGKPKFLYGHSLGGILVLFYALKRKPQLNGVIATSPGLRTALESQKLKISLSKTLGSLIPTACLPSGLDVEAISRDGAVVQKYRNDPLVHDQVSFGMAKCTLDVIPWVFEHAREFNLPLLIMHGTADEIAYSRGSEEFASQVLGDSTLKLWEGLYHETHNEPEKDQVLDFLVAWLDQKS